MLFLRPIAILASLGAAHLAAALGEERVITFPIALDADLPLTDSPSSSGDAQFVLDPASSYHSNGANGGSDFIIASQHRKHAAPLLLDSHDDVAVHIAAQTFADDVYRVTGQKPQLYNDTLPSGLGAEVDAIVVGTVDSHLIKGVRGVKKIREDLEGKWESYDIGVVEGAVKGSKESLVIVGSDRRGTIYALYTLSEQMGVSPWHFWSDVPVRARPTVGFDKSKSLSHGEPTVKYRGLFINDEHPALWGWAQKYFNYNYWEPSFQAEFYEKWFEMLLRLKGNYQWPAMYISMFSVDGLDVSNGLPKEPIKGPNKELAQRMGVVMGTSHHEPMDRTKPEWDHVRVGPWDWTNKDVLQKHWRYGAERAKGTETLFTMGMRGDGDEPMTGASIELVENITSIQQDILKDVYGDDYVKIPKMWAMYKEVSDYYNDGLKIPDDITVLFSDDNWGNIINVMDPAKAHPGGAGVYYHVDYVGWPRAYKWINTINLAKTAEQMNIARAFNTTSIWILNVGSLKPLEMPSEHFMALAYDSDVWPTNDVGKFLKAWAARDFGEEFADEIADIMGHYGQYASRRKPEGLNSTLFSYVNYEEAERVQEEWDTLAERARKVQEALPEDTKPAFYQNVYMLCLMQANINRLYIHVGKSNLLASQYRTSANTHAYGALHAFHHDFNLTETFHALLDRKWDHALDQTHINWQSTLEEDRESLPPISFIDPRRANIPGIPQRPLTTPLFYHLRVTVENSIGSWPGANLWNCPAGHFCPDPTLFTLDPYGAKSRWFEVGNAGPREVGWTAKAEVPWLTLSAEGGKLKNDASTDKRVYVGVDWEQVPKGAGWINGTVTIQGEDGANVTLSIPVNKLAAPAKDFKGHVEGDGYVVMEAAHYSSAEEKQGYKLEELKWYGRTLSGLEMLPATAQNFTAGEGPSVSYDFWTHGITSSSAYSLDGNKTLPTPELTVQVGPSLNWLLGKQLAFAYSLDGSEPKPIFPVPTKRIGPLYEKPGGTGHFVGAVPEDWVEIVKADIRNVTIPLPQDLVQQGGKHTLTLYGMTTGVVFERVWVDLGGINARGYSYLGPPESLRV